MSATAAAAAAPADAVPLVFAAAACLKLLLLPAYFSTDFDVHRNWLAVTQLPLREWYTEATSEWTLDYPPLFGWLEYALSFPAQLFDPGMLEISAEPYRSPATVVFQRLSVVASDVTLLLACWLCWPGASSRFGIAVLVFFNTGFFIVDAIHFQYNGFLFGILLISMAYLKRVRDCWDCGLVMLTCGAQLPASFGGCRSRICWAQRRLRHCSTSSTFSCTLRRHTLCFCYGHTACSVASAPRLHALLCLGQL
eukprot:m.51141 g.51141  ORF g.51141 m.51141 type:complete len:252 (+) comp6588_c0_seq4:1-756(+)